jgi:hypothetical protein
VGVDEGSSNQYKCSDGNIDLNCINRVSLNDELQNVLKWVRSRIALLQKEKNNTQVLQPLFHGYNLPGSQSVAVLQCGKSNIWIF